eukprot:scaffold218352_cov42-Prasinocladus_malaysianus.AAC.1
MSRVMLVRHGMIGSEVIVGLQGVHFHEVQWIRQDLCQRSQGAARTRFVGDERPICDSEHRGQLDEEQNSAK